MTVYSHSRLSCYEHCPAKFKLQYIDKVETEGAESVEAFLGSRVHETLEKLYRDLDHQKTSTLEELFEFLRSEWKSNWSEDIVIVNEEYTQENYLKMAEKYVSDYYQRYHPFHQGKTIALEERIQITLDPEGRYKMQGYIDRLTEVKDGFYEIHDYKTNSRLPLAEYLRTDRQLALYMIGVKDAYPDVRDVRLVWHFLKFDKEVDSTRSDAELIALKADTIKLIQQIEQDETYPANPGVLCSWCEFKETCPQWRHFSMISEKPENEYLNDPGVKLVNRYAEVKRRQKTINDECDSEIEKLEEALLAFAQKEHVDCVFGSRNRVRITDTVRYSFPSKNSREREELEEALRRQGRLAEVQQLDTTVLGRVFQEGLWDEPLLDLLRKYVAVERKKRLYLGKLKEKE
jgi:putative RecB family exonuclease